MIIFLNDPPIWSSCSPYISFSNGEVCIFTRSWSVFDLGIPHTAPDDRNGYCHLLTTLPKVLYRFKFSSSFLPPFPSFSLGSEDYHEETVASVS